MWLKSQAPEVTELMLAWRRRRRTRRMLNQIRSIRRVHPQLNLTYRREKINIYINLDPKDLLFFDLIWPSDLPKFFPVKDAETLNRLQLGLI
jgi:hypothetical protein